MNGSIGTRQPGVRWMVAGLPRAARSPAGPAPWWSGPLRPACHLRRAAAI